MSSRSDRNQECNDKSELSDTLLMHDTLLMQRLAIRNDTVAFDTLFLRHRQAVFGFALRLLEGRSESIAVAEDVTQETFLRLWRARAIYRPRNGASLRTYLLTITRRLVLDIIKRPQREPPERDHSDHATERERPEHRLLVSELQDVVAQALNNLPLTLREVIILRDIENLRYEEIAVIVGCPLGTVRSRLHTARAHLRTYVLLYLKEDTDE